MSSKHDLPDICKSDSTPLNNGGFKAHIFPAEKNTSSHSMGTVKNAIPYLPKVLTSGYDNGSFNRTLPPITSVILETYHHHLPSSKNTSISPPAPGVQSKATSPESNNIKTATDLQRRNVNQAVEQYKKLIPRLNQVTADNFGGIIVDVLKETENEVPLDDFFRLFYTSQPSGYSPIMSSLESSSHKLFTLEARSSGSVLCRLIYDTFMDPVSAATYFGIKTGPYWGQVNTHEFHRVFLATKILLHCIKETKERKSSLSKSHIFNTYQIYIYRLFSTNSSFSDGISPSGNLLLGYSNMGKAMKMIFTDVSTQRLGKRGRSKYHFSGLAWKESALDNEIRELMELEPTKVKANLENMFSKARKKIESPVNIPRPPVGKPDISTPSFVPTPLLSYVNSSNRFPATDFSPRLKEIVPGKVPQQPDWWREKMLRSVNALKLYDLNLEPLIRETETDGYSTELVKRLNWEVLCAEEKLHQNSSEDGYLHLQLALLMLVFSGAVSSDEEVSRASKTLVCGFLRNFVKVLEERGSEQPSFEKDHRRIFSSNVQKMINITETISVNLPREVASGVLQALGEISGELQNESGPGEVTNLDALSARAGITMLNAYPHIFPTSELAKIDLVSDLVENFRFIMAESEINVRGILADIHSGNANANKGDLRFEIFKKFAEVIHRSVRHRAVFLETPMFVLKVSIRELDKQVQLLIFQAFGRYHPEVAKESFKIWWLLCSAFHEYINIISEVTALSQRFD